nr:hypothetical protein [Mycoplasmopsis bovis]
MYQVWLNIFLLDNELKINELYEFDKCTKIPNIYLNEKRKEYYCIKKSNLVKNNIYMILTKVILKRAIALFVV